METVVENLINSEDDEDKMLGFAVLGGDIEGLRYGGRIKTLV